VSPSKKFIFTDFDLDGCMSYLLFLWFNSGKRIPYITVNINNFNKSFKTWSRSSNPDRYDHIYILDLDTSQESLDLVDRSNVVIIDHHDTHVDNKDRYKRCKSFISDRPSCCRHIYELLAKQSDVVLSDAQKHLILLVDDYDCYNLQLKHSHSLNILFWNYQGDRLSKFINRFNNGFDGFTDEEQSVIKFYNKKIDRVISDLKLFEAEIPISGTKYKFMSTFATECINDVAHHVIDKMGADIGVVVNLNTNKVSYRKNKSIDLNLSTIARKLNSGGGHKCASGGVLTPDFMNFSKLFRPIV
jgi:oligoribonuclease NrnB/cAMP/cGMP phosphodiesterase (DHH superfamily)